MNNKLFKQFKKYSKDRPQEKQEIAGILGLPVTSKTVLVPGRAGYVYVRLRNTNEIVQVFNDKVSAVYDLPVLLNWVGGIYKITSRDSKRYASWGASSSFLPEHSHYLVPSIAVQDEGLAVGTGTTLNFVGDNVSVTMVGDTARVAIIDSTGNQPVTGSIVFWDEGVTKGSATILDIIGINADVSISGTVARLFITGSASGANTELSNLGTTAVNTDIIPSADMSWGLGQPNKHWLSGWFGKISLEIQTGISSPMSGDRTVWASSDGNLHTFPYGGSDSLLLTDAPSDGYVYGRKDGAWEIVSGSAGGSAEPPITGSIVFQDEGVIQGSALILNVVGANADVSISGSVARLFITGSVGGSANPPITGSVVILDDGSSQGSALLLNFGDNLSATISGSTAQINVTNLPAPVNADGVIIWNEGTPLGTGSVLNFVGDNIDVTMSGSVATVFVTGSSSAQKIMQVVNTSMATGSAHTTLIPWDDTIPQNTEGEEIMTVSITPSSASNKLLIEVIVHVSHSATSNRIVALFQDSVADALSATVSGQLGGYSTYLNIAHWMVAGTTSPITFKIRVGSNVSGTLTVNGSGGSRYLGGAFVSSITVTEISA